MCRSSQGGSDITQTGALGPPVNGGDQLTVIDYVGAAGEKSNGRVRWKVQLIWGK